MRSGVPPYLRSGRGLLGSEHVGGGSDIGRIWKYLAALCPISHTNTGIYQVPVHYMKPIRTACRKRSNLTISWETTEVSLRSSVPFAQLEYFVVHIISRIDAQTDLTATNHIERTDNIEIQKLEKKI